MVVRAVLGVASGVFVLGLGAAAADADPDGLVVFGLVLSGAVLLGRPLVTAASIVLAALLLAGVVVLTCRSARVSPAGAVSSRRDTLADGCYSLAVAIVR
jgi:hypothetical protein